jgi:hypothetical protein
METLETWMSDLRALSRDLQSPAVMEHLDMRAAALAKKRNDFAEGLGSLAKLRSAFISNP